MAFSRLVLRAIDLPPPNNLAMARGLGEGAVPEEGADGGGGREYPTSAGGEACGCSEAPAKA